MSKETTDAGNQGDWENLLATIGAHMDVFAHLEPMRSRLAAYRDQTVGLKQQQAALIASKQDLSKQLRVAITEGNRLATLLRSAVKQHYGIRAERSPSSAYSRSAARTRRRSHRPTFSPPTPPSSAFLISGDVLRHVPSFLPA